MSDEPANADFDSNYDSDFEFDLHSQTVCRLETRLPFKSCTYVGAYHDGRPCTEDRADVEYRDRYSWESVRGLALIDARRYAKLDGTRAKQTASIGSDFASVTGKQTRRLRMEIETRRGRD